MHSLLGRDIYKLLTIKHSFVSFINARKYRLKWDDNIEVIDSSCIMVTNQAKMGGNILVHPDAKINDGKFNVFVSKETKALPLIKSLSDMSRGVVPRNSLLIETENLIIESVDGSKVSYFGDGEVFGNANRMNFSIQKQAQPFVSDMERVRLMKILITGGTGFLGKKVINELLSDSSISEICIITRRARYSENPRLKYMKLDLSKSFNSAKAFSGD